MHATNPLPPSAKDAPNPAAPTPASVLSLLVAALERHWSRHRNARQRCRQCCTEDSVHDLRTEARRLLACLELLGVLFFFSALTEARRLMKRRLTVSGGLRDLHVQLQLATEVPGSELELGSFRAQILAAEAREARRLAQRLKEPRLAKSIAALRKFLRWMPADPRSDRRSRRLLRGMMARKFDRMAGLQRRALAEAGSLHAARVALKKFRYMAEVLKPVLGPGCADELELLHRCQGKQGAIHDLDLILARLATARTPAGEKPGTTCRALSRQRSALWRSYRALAGRCFRDEPALARMKMALTHPANLPPTPRK